jgi:tellurite methyltransferase
MSEESEYWERYYEVTAERPAWGTVCRAIELFAAEDAAAGRGARAPGTTPRLAVDLGCGGGRDARQLLRAGWRVVAVDREAGSGEALERYVEPEARDRLEIVTADLADVEVPACDLVNASLSLPFLELEAFARTWARIIDALAPGARFAAMLFGDRDGSASEPGMTCLPPERVKADLEGFEIEMWSDREEDTKTALGDPHHFHLVEFVARRTA